MFTAMFDSRVFSVPKEEVCNCLIWRQQDATRNSIEAVGQANFSHHELHKKTCNMIQEIIPPCKVGDTVWVITGTAIKLCTVDRIHIWGNGQVQIRAKYFVTDNIYLYPDMFGKTVFLTCAEAEAAIEARKGGKE